MWLWWRWGLPHAVSVANGNQQGTQGGGVASDRARQGARGAAIASLLNMGLGYA